MGGPGRPRALVAVSRVAPDIVTVGLVRQDRRMPPIEDQRRASVTYASSSLIGDALSQRLTTVNVTIGEPGRVDPSWWDVELERARPSLELMARRIDQVMAQGLKPISALTRCAVALATQPVVLRHRPDAVVVWMDAHADLNEPGNTTTGYLGGMALSGVLGWWDSGLGAGLPPSQAVLVGARDLDPAEQAQIEAGRVVTVAVGEGL